MFQLNDIYIDHRYHPLHFPYNHPHGGTKFCIMEITRQRVRPEMEIKTGESCPTCQGSGKITASVNLIDEIENNIKFILKKEKRKYLCIKTHPFVSAFLNKGWLKSIRKRWQKNYKCEIEIFPMVAYTYMEYHFFDSKDDEIFY